MGIELYIGKVDTNSDMGHTCIITEEVVMDLSDANPQQFYLKDYRETCLLPTLNLSSGILHGDFKSIGVL